MLSESIKFCKRLFIKATESQKELYLAMVVILVAVISFGLGRLSKIREEKTPITIENIDPDAVSTSSAININANKAVTNKNDKIFVASKNGKKYYYAWCESAKIIKEQNRVWFSTKEQAEKAGYSPAVNCKGLQ